MANSQTYTLNIVVQGEDKASGPLGKSSGALASIGEIAAGIVSSKIFMQIVDSILNMGKSAISATADFQMLTVGLESLLAREISRGTTTSQLTEQRINLTDEEKLKMIELQQTYEILGGQISEVQKRYDEVAASQGVNSEEALRLKIELNSLNNDLSTTNYYLSDLKDKSDGSYLALQAVTTGTMSLAEAMPQAEGKAQELLKQIRTLSIQSPYELDQVQQTLKLGMAFGFTSDEAMSFTRGILTMSAGVGASNEMMGRMAYNLAQVRLQGKVTQMDVRQLAMAGFDLEGALQSIAKQFGYTISGHEEFNELIEEGKLKWSDFAGAFEQYADDSFGGAAERLSQTWNGLKSNFNDIFALTMPSILGPSMEKITGFLNGFMSQFIDFSNSGKLEEWGNKIGNVVGKVIDFFNGFDGAKSKLSDFFGMINSGDSVGGAFSEVFNISLPPELSSMFDTIVGLVDRIREAGEKAKPVLEGAFEKFGQFWQDNGPGIVQLIQDINVKMGEVRADTFEKVGEVLGWLAENVIPWWVEQIDKISQWFVENGPLIQNFLEQMKVGLSIYGEVLKGIFSVVVEVIKLLWNVLEPILSGIFTIIGDLVTFIMQIATGDWAGAWNSLKDIAFTILNSIVEGIIGFWNTVLGWFGIKMVSLNTTWVEKWNLMAEFVKNLWLQIKEAIQNKYEEIKEGITQFLKDGVELVRSKIASWKQIGKDLIQGLWDGLAEKVAAVISWLEEKWNEISKLTRKIFGVRSPSTVFAEIGENLMLGLAKGIGDGAEFPVSAIVNASDKVTRAMPGTLGSTSTSTVTNANRVEINVLGARDPEQVALEIYNILTGQGLVLAA